MIEIYWLLFYTFFKVGLFTIGGGYAMIPLIRQEVVNHGWITSEQLTDFIAVAESTPGPFAVNTATFVGVEVGGFLGGFFATLGVVLPSFFIILIVATLFKTFADNRFVKAGMKGLRPIVLGLLSGSVILLAYPVLSRKTELPTGIYLLFSGVILIFVGLVSWKRNVHPALLILLSAILGVLFFGVIGQKLI